MKALLNWIGGIIGAVVAAVAIHYLTQPKLPTEIPQVAQSSTPLPPAVNGSVDQPSIQSTSISLPQAEIIPSSSPSLTFERKGVVDDDVVGGSSNLRSFPDLEDPNNILTAFPNGTPVIIIEESKNASDQVWYKVRVGKKEGWMNGKIIKVDY